jgi:hypothetical protein
VDDEIGVRRISCQESELVFDYAISEGYCNESRGDWDNRECKTLVYASSQIGENYSVEKEYPNVYSADEGGSEGDSSELCKIFRSGLLRLF